MKIIHAIILLSFCLLGSNFTLADTTLTNNAVTAQDGLHLKKIPFNVALDIYAKLSHRVLLVHPAIDRSAVSLEADWTNETPSQAEITAAFGKVFAERQAAVVVDGGKFLQIIPANMVQTASPNSKDIPVVTGEPRGTVDFQGVSAGVLVKLYGQITGLRRIGDEPTTGNIFYFKTSSPLSKPEVIYAFETLLAWNGTKVITHQDGTFSLAKSSISTKP